MNHLDVALAARAFAAGRGVRSATVRHRRLVPNPLAVVLWQLGAEPFSAAAIGWGDAHARPHMAVAGEPRNRDLAFAGTTFAARTGLEAAEAASELGFAVGGGDIAGALVSAGITEDDIAAGLYDDAAVESWLVNWAEPAGRLLLDTGSIGEVRRADGAFVRQWLAPRTGTWAGVLDHVVDMSVGSVADGPPVATLLTPDSVVRVVLE